ncbi:MAG: radical SAM family heme chaperone HemW, partial [Oscillospiraceae bacterium]
MDQTLGLYIHIPFCHSKCAYCDFYSLPGQEKRMDDYQRALLHHLAEAAPRAASYTVDTVYFGGGTPSFYGEKRLIELLKWVKKKYKVDKQAEITLEANPDSVDQKMLKRLRRAGVNRISLGVQSADDGQLASLGRPHTFAQASQAVAWARKAKFQNLSLDLIYGLPGQSMASWRDTVEQVLSLEPEHISAYGLKVEEGTPLFCRVEKGEVLPDDDAQADCYLWTVERLERAGYGQYEISNFARPGFSSRHNCKYWLT